MDRATVRSVALALSAALVLAACASGGALAPEVPWLSGQTWHRDTLAIANEASNDGRRAAIEARLAELGLSATPHAFTSAHGPGTNLIVALPDSRDLPVLLIGAHYDRVPRGQGAVDNASGCATVLDLGAALMRRPLAHHRVVLAFWDQEELGLLGSKAYLAEHAAPWLYLNFDVFGYGDTLWGMVANRPAFARAMGDAAAAGGVAASLGNDYPPSDHLAFIARDVPAVSLSLVGGEEIEPILVGFAGGRPAVMPKVLEVIHTPRDVPAELDPVAVVRVLPIVLDGVRRWDAMR